MVDADTHARFIAHFNIGERQDGLHTSPEFQARPPQRMTIQAYRTRFMRLKNLAQWKTKLQQLGGVPEDVQGLVSLQQVFAYIYHQWWDEWVGA